MGYGLDVTRVALGAAVLLIIGASAEAEPREPLLVTRLSDPDPNYVAPVARQRETRGTSEAEANVRVDEAMESFGQAIGQAEMIEQQQIDALCKAGAPVNATREQLFAYEASCRYSRH